MQIDMYCRILPDIDNERLGVNYPISRTNTCNSLYYASQNSVTIFYEMTVSN